MAAQPIDSLDFERRLGDAAEDPRLVRRLYSYYCELVRWNQRLSLVADGDLGRVVERHFLESLAALPMIRSGARSLVDVGSGGGFPGLVLGAALPSVRITLVEARDRKWAFLKRAAAVAGVRANCVHGRVDRTLPAGIPGGVDLVTLRAVRLPMAAWHALTDRLSPMGQVLVWTGASALALPPAFRQVQETALADSQSRRLVCFERV